MNLAKGIKLKGFFGTGPAGRTHGFSRLKVIWVLKKSGRRFLEDCRPLGAEQKENAKDNGFFLALVRLGRTHGLHG